MLEQPDATRTILLGMWEYVTKEDRSKKKLCDVPESRYTSLLFKLLAMNAFVVSFSNMTKFAIGSKCEFDVNH